MNGTRIAATLTVLGLFGAAATGLAFAHPSVPVTLTVDGHVETASTTAGTVKALLESQHVAVGPRAEVNPGLDNVIYAHENIQVHHAWHLAVRADGASKSVWTTADTVGAALKRIGVKVGPYDKVSAPLTSGHKDTTVVVKRGTAKNMTLTVTLAKPVKQVPDASMTQGTTKVLKAGRDGTEQSRVTLVYLDGKIDHVKVLSRKVTVKPVGEVVAVGTQPPPPRPGTGTCPRRAVRAVGSRPRHHERGVGEGGLLRDGQQPEHRGRPVLRHVHDDAGRLACRRRHGPTEPGLGGRADHAGAESSTTSSAAGRGRCAGGTCPRSACRRVGT